MKVTEKNEQKRRICLVAILTILLLIFSLHFLGKLHMPFIYNDEYGYWVGAARYAGYDWSGIFSKIAYYSYGYGIILTLLYRITENVNIIYNLALMLNGVWLILSFYLLYLTGREMYPEEKAERLLIVAFLATCLPGNMTQAHYTWPENFLFMLFCLAAYLLICIIKKPTIYKCTALGLVSVFSYAVHQRTIALVIAAGMILLYLLYMRKLKWKHLISFICIVAIAFALHVWLKYDITNSVWTGGDELAVNNFEGQFGKLSSLFTVSGIKNLILSFGGKFFYVIITSMFLVLFSVEKLLVNCKNIIACTKSHNFEDIYVFKMFLMLTFLGTLGVSAIFMINPVGTVHIVYGRYNENILGPFIILALIELRHCKIDYRRFFVYLFCAVLLGVGVTYSAKLFDTNGTAAVNSVGLANYISSKAVDVWPVILASLVGFIVIHILLSKGLLGEVLVYILCLAVWIPLGYNAYNIFNSGGWKNAAESTMQCVEVISEIEKENDDEECPLYVMNGGTSFPSRFSGNGIQYWFPDREIPYVTLEDIHNGKCDENGIIIAPSCVKKVDGWNILFRSQEYYLMVSENNQIIDNK